MIPAYDWRLSDLQNIPMNGTKVFSTFSCGGGSGMGYRRAGCKVEVASDIDPDVADHYRKNLSPSHFFVGPICDLAKQSLPTFDVDILDGSPPCSTFSISGNREDDWGKNKAFREGQATQVLSDLFFEFIRLADHLRPKTIIAENVTGIIKGNAKGYCKMIVEALGKIGYVTQIFVVNAADCGVPQRRERVFFCSRLKSNTRKPLILAPIEKWASVRDAFRTVVNSEEDIADAIKKTSKTHFKYWPKTKQGESYSKANERGSFFNYIRLALNTPSNTIASHHHCYAHPTQCRVLTKPEFIRIGGFPDDYWSRTDSAAKYIIGMSVPPAMTEFVARAVVDQWL